MDSRESQRMRSARHILLLCGQPRACSTAAAPWSDWATLRPVGYVQSIYPTKFGCPRQGAVVPAAAAKLKIRLEDGLDARAALEGLDEYSHVWLLWCAHLNGQSATRSKVLAPKLRGGRAGLFATRTPFRPTPMGLSLVRLRGVHGDTLQLSGVDLVDGTPVFDVKPYLPSYDTPPVAEEVCVPSWVDPPPLPVRFTPEAEARLEAIAARRGHSSGSTRSSGGDGSGSGSILRGSSELRRAIEQTLAADPRPLYRWRRDGDGAEYDVPIDGLVARCRFEGGAADDAEVVVVLGLQLAED